MTAIPGAYEPVLIDGDLSVDGCLTASVDLATAAQMGATEILAIALAPPVATRTPNTLLGVPASPSASSPTQPSRPWNSARGAGAPAHGAPEIAFGDIIGANIVACLEAIPLWAIMVSLPFTKRVFLYAAYAAAAVPVSVLGAVFVWDGPLSRGEGAVMCALCVVYVGSDLDLRAEAARHGRSQ